MNWALLAKLAWRLLVDEGNVWVEVIKAKYGVRREDGAHLRMRQRVSQILKGILWETELLRGGLNGRSTTGREFYSEEIHGWETSR